MVVLQDNLTLNRRAAVTGAVAATALGWLPASAQTPESTPAPFEPQLPPGSLDPVTAPPSWDVEKNYDTTLVEPVEPTDYCSLKLFPSVPNSVNAASVLMQGPDLNASPNMVLLQYFQYADSAAAASDFGHVVNEVQTLFAEKYYLAGPADLDVDTATATLAITGHSAPNGTGYAQVVELAGSAIVMFRAPAVQAAPPIDALKELASSLLAQDDVVAAAGDSPLPSLPPIDSSAYPTLDLPWSIAGWTWNFGPLDIHPDRYYSPACEIS